MARKAPGKRKMCISGGASSEPSPAAEIIASNVDLLTELLQLLPAKSLVRFKCVSKHWLSLISDSHFAASHARRRRNPPISALYLSWYSSYCSNLLRSVSLHGCEGDHPHPPPLAFLHGVGGEKDRKWITQSCNGLFLFEFEQGDPDRYEGYPRYYVVCNPTTQKYRRIPDQPVGHVPGKVRPRACLAFDPSKSPHYKVVLLDFHRVDSYSSESGCWKQILAPVSGFQWLLSPVFCGGAIHWLSNDGGVLFRFDIDAEKTIEMWNPSSPKILPVDKIRYFGECGGHLVLIQTRLPSAVGFRILEMDTDYSRWIVRRRVNLRPMISDLFPLESIAYDRFSVLWVVEGEEGKDFELVLTAHECGHRPTGGGISNNLFKPTQTTTRFDDLNNSEPTSHWISLFL